MSDSFFKELRRRNVFKVGIAYLVLAWLVIQITQAAIPALHLPDWINSAVFFFGLIGFPFAIFFAWAFEITPEGIKKESEIKPEESVTAHTGRKLDFIIIGLLAVGMVYFIYESRFEDSTDQSNVTTDNNINSNSEPVYEPSESVTIPDGSSIAVLPFVNMSSDKEQEYFSDGISEEILNVLAKIPHLKVTSRSSSFYFKDSKINLSEVANKLGVKNILEGSVRKFGNRIRITAQLIEAESDSHLWSETYDRELVDLFVIQDEISAAIVDALKSKLGLEVAAVNRDLSTVNLDAHNAYLQGRYYLEKRTEVNLKKALQFFDNAINISSDYAPAWMGKSLVSLFLSENQYGTIPIEIASHNALEAIEKALILDPQLPESHAIRGLIFAVNGERLNAIPFYQKAIKINPNYAEAYIWYSFTQRSNLRKKLELRAQAVKLNPMSLLANENYSESLSDFALFEEAEDVLDHMESIDKDSFLTHYSIGNIRMRQNHHGKAAYYAYKDVSTNPAMRHKLDYANLLANIGLPEETASVFDGTELEVIKYFYQNNQELYISQARTHYPRSVDDKLGALWRARAEFMAENYREAITYYESSFCTECVELIYAYKQVGEEVKAIELLEQRKRRYHSAIEQGVKFRRERGVTLSIEIDKFEIDYLDGNLDSAIQHLKNEINNGNVIDYNYLYSTMYKKLRNHPGWLAIRATSAKKENEQRAIYLMLKAEEKRSQTDEVIKSNF